ncbi:MAG: toprim domain-containing protein [Gammaproteobacteria bacterium]
MSKTTRSPCLVCDRGPRDTALATTTDERGTRRYCHRCGYVSIENYERRPLESPIRATKAAQVDWSALAESIWRRTSALRGTLGETYLHHRGCALPPPDSHVRFLPATDKHPPSLCAAITDAVTAQQISLHFTRLAADGHGKAGTDRDKSLLAGHRKRGGCVRIWSDEAVTYGLAIAEGIETALAAAHAFTPTWAAIDAGNMASFPLLAGIEALTVFADHDDAGLTAAATLARRWADAGREVLIVSPGVAGQDIADVVA